MEIPAPKTLRPMVSVALCTHNGADFLGAQLHSILNQTRVPDEIVVSDDASTDATLSLVHEIFRDRAAPTLTVIQNSTALGVTANFAQALAACSGDLLVLCDQDDVWSPVKIEQMLAEFAVRPRLLLLHSDARLVGQDGEPTGVMLFGALSLSAEEKRSVHENGAFSVLLRRNIVTGATAMVRRELVERAGPFPASWVHDEWLAVIAAATGEMDMLEAPLIDYRQHGRNEIGVSRLTLGIGISRLCVSRADRNARLLSRAQSLADRVESLGFTATESVAQAVEEKLEHERIRSGLPVSRVRRLRPVVAEWSTGRYARYGLGLQDILRDLTQPA